MVRCVLLVGCALVPLIARAAPPRGDELTTAELGPDCKLATEPYPGSLHAATSYEVPMLVPKSRSHQSIQCGKNAAAAYFYIYDRASITTAATGLGARLWGGPAPTFEHPDELLVAHETAIVVSGPARLPVIDKLKKKGFVPYRDKAPVSNGDRVEELERVIKCDDPNEALRAWCPATALRRSNYRSPAQAAVYLGLSVRVKSGQQLTRETLLRDASLAMLIAAPGRIAVRALTPSNDSERADLFLVTASVAAALKGKPDPIVVKADLANFLASVKNDTAKTVPITDTATGFATYEVRNAQGEIHARTALVDYPSIGKVYVVVEETAGFTHVNVFPTVAVGK